MPDKLCRTCKWWGRVPVLDKLQVLTAEQRAKSGQAACGSRMVGNAPDPGDGDLEWDGAIDAEAYGGIYTGPRFGCIHHESIEQGDKTCPK